MSLYENKSKENLINKDLSKNFLTKKNFLQLLIIYAIVSVSINISTIIGDDFYNTTKGLIGYFLGFSIITLSFLYLMKQSPIFILLISCIYGLGAASIIPLMIDNKGLYDADSVIFYGDSFWFFTTLINVTNFDFSLKTLHYLQFLPASIIFGIMYLLEINKRKFN